MYLARVHASARSTSWRPIASQGGWPCARCPSVAGRLSARTPRRIEHPEYIQQLVELRRQVTGQVEKARANRVEGDLNTERRSSAVAELAHSDQRGNDRVGRWGPTPASRRQDCGSVDLQRPRCDQSGRSGSWSAERPQLPLPSFSLLCEQRRQRGGSSKGLRLL